MPGEPAAPDPDWPRWSARPLPPYRFVPGVTPHPHRDPGGHGMAGAPPTPACWKPVEWRSLEPWLYGIDLHNRAFWWEAHEVLEGLWKAAGRTTPEARFVQGLIHVAAAHLNRHRGRAAAARRQAERGVRRLAAAPHGPRTMGLDVPDFARRVRDSFAEPDGAPALARLDLEPVGAEDV